MPTFVNEFICRLWFLSLTKSRRQLARVHGCIKIKCLAERRTGKERGRDSSNGPCVGAKRRKTSHRKNGKNGTSLVYFLLSCNSTQLLQCLSLSFSSSVFCLSFHSTPLSLTLFSSYSLAGSCFILTLHTYHIPFHN